MRAASGRSGSYIGVNNSASFSGSVLGNAVLVSNQLWRHADISVLKIRDEIDPFRIVFEVMIAGNSEAVPRGRTIEQLVKIHLASKEGQGTTGSGRVELSTPAFVPM